MREIKIEIKNCKCCSQFKHTATHPTPQKHFIKMAEH